MLKRSCKAESFALLSALQLIEFPLSVYLFQHIENHTVLINQNCCQIYNLSRLNFLKFPVGEFSQTPLA